MTKKAVNKTLGKIIEAFKSGQFDEIKSLVQQAVDEGTEPARILDDGLVVGIREVGEQFRRGEVYLPEMMMSAEAWQEGMNLLKPHLAEAQTPIKSVGKIVIGTVMGDIHSLGKNIVATMLKAANFEVIDLGMEVPASKFVEEAEKHGAHIIAASALMTTTMPHQRDIIEHLEAARKREDFFVMVGGGPTNETWAEEIKADAYGETAADAVSLAFEQMESLKKGAGS